MVTSSAQGGVRYAGLLEKPAVVAAVAAPTPGIQADPG
jgi:hypothetical protein